MSTVKIINPLTETALTVNTCATTWGGLKEELKERSEFKDVDFEDFCVFQKGQTSRKGLVLNSDELIEDEQTKIFINIKKQIGGIDIPEDLESLEELRNRIDDLFDAVADIVEKDEEEKTMTEDDRKDYEDSLR